jgi:hypothetical protein
MHRRCDGDFFDGAIIAFSTFGTTSQAMIFGRRSTKKSKNLTIVGIWNAVQNVKESRKSRILLSDQAIASFSRKISKIFTALPNVIRTAMMNQDF